jgi:hypothetical protein
MLTITIFQYRTHIRARFERSFGNCDVKNLKAQIPSNVNNFFTRFNLQKLSLLNAKALIVSTLEDEHS